MVLDLASEALLESSEILLNLESSILKVQDTSSIQRKADAFNIMKENEREKEKEKRERERK